MEMWLFSHLCTPMSCPMTFFLFFPCIIWWLKYRSVDFKQKQNSFNSISSVFDHFCRFFQHLTFWPIWPLLHTIWITPHHQWPQFQLLYPLYFIILWETFPMNFINDYQSIFLKCPFFHLWPFQSLRTPHMGCVWLWVKSLIWSWN